MAVDEPLGAPPTRIMRLLETCHTNLMSLMMVCNPARSLVEVELAGLVLVKPLGLRCRGYWGRAARITAACSPIRGMSGGRWCILVPLESGAIRILLSSCNGSGMTMAGNAFLG